MPLPSKSLRVLALAIGAALAIAACSAPGGAGPTTARSIPTTSNLAEPATTIAPTTAPGGTLPRPSVPGLTIDPTKQSAPTLASIAAFESLAKSSVGGQQAVKFSITDFLGDPTVEWLDSQFYTLHDEWYWFQLLNGNQVDGFDTQPVSGLAFDNIAEVYEWAEQNRTDLPLDLRFTSLDRLYSPSFYKTALDDPAVRPVALGSVIRVPARSAPDQPERWLLELEYRDAANAFQIERFFRLLLETLPDEIAQGLVWVPRSREQELVAEEMTNQGLPYGDRTIRFSDLLVPGDVEVYADGVAAGRLLFVTDDGRYSLSDAGPNDIVVVQRTPDVLPPGNALITGTPQTPLAHVNVLALNRGIPNAFLGGLVDNPELSQLGRVRAPVAVRAIGPDQLDIRALTDTEFDEWKALRGTTAISVPELDLDSLLLTLDLARPAGVPLSEAQLDLLRPAIGGKAAGFFGLAAPGTVSMPDHPIVITVRPYFEHLAQLSKPLDAMLQSEEFAASSRARFFLLEGRPDFEQTYTASGDVTFAAQFVEEHPPGTALGDIVAANGFKQMIRDLAIDPTTLAAIESLLMTKFLDFAPNQGLRFRSSSSVEDIEGFNGAGLYSSNTGYIDPTVLPDEGDHKRTVERALKRTWSSYWNAEAVEERRFENVDHRSGGMAVLVHARFDDPLEVSNGVATFAVLPQRGGFVMKLNVQMGDTSVTNPDNEPGQTPEIVEVRQMSTGEQPVIERVVASSLVADGGVVLGDERILSIWDQLRDVTVAWQARLNSDLPRDQKTTTLTLDFEFREMAEEWPALASGATPEGPRIVIKQARTLEPGLRAVPAALLDLPAPRDVLARTTRAVRITCPASGTDSADDTSNTGDVFVDLYTDPLAAVDMGYSITPLRVLESGSATRLVDDGCTTSEAFASASDYLHNLFDARDN